MPRMRTQYPNRTLFLPKVQEHRYRLGLAPRAGESRGNMTATEIKTLRLSLGLSQIELAERLGYHPASICRWEAGTQHPTRRVVKQLMRLRKKEAKK